MNQNCTPKHTRPVILTSGYKLVLAEDARHGLGMLRNPYAVEDLSRILRKVGGRSPRGIGVRPRRGVADKGQRASWAMRGMASGSETLKRLF